MLNYILSFPNTRDVFLAGVACLAAIMYAIIIHEYAHGYVAKLNGDNTAELSGRLSFSPSKHFDIMGIMMFLLLGFGWAKPVPIDPRNFKNHKKGMITTSIAGVCANFVSALIAGILFSLLVIILNSATITDGSIGYMIIFLIAQFLIVSIIINIALIVFNLLPIYPLDGFRVVATLTKPNNRFVKFMRQYGLYVLLGLLMFGWLFGNISPWLDPLGMYLSFMNTILIKLLGAIFPALA